MTTRHSYKLYDFDYTIYRGNSAIDFYVACIRKNPVLVLYGFVQVLHLILYFLHLESKDSFKGNYFGFIRYITKNRDEYIRYFWKINTRKMSTWYLEKDNHSNDVIVSASPSYYLDSLKELYGVKDVIATEVDPENGRLISKNCYGIEKVARIQEKFLDALFSEAYTDSSSDLPMVTLAAKAYIVKGNIIREYTK